MLDKIKDMFLKYELIMPNVTLNMDTIVTIH